MTDASFLSDDFQSEAGIISSAALPDDAKRAQLSQRFSRAASNGDITQVQRLWESCEGTKWIDIDYRDEEGSTPLICASAFGHASIAEMLLEYGADVDAQDKSGWTALMWATTKHDEELVRTLLEHGASSSAKTARGHTAMNIASSNLSGSDTESFRPISDAPSPREEAMTLSAERALSPRSSEFDHSDLVPPGSPHSSISTPRTRGTRGQSVLDMLQASTIRAGKRTSGSSVVSTDDRSGMSGNTSRVASDGLGLAITTSDSEAAAANELGDRLRTLTMDSKAEYQEKLKSNGDSGFSEDGDENNDDPAKFDWDTLQLDQMYVISEETIPKLLHAIVREIKPERWIQDGVTGEHKFVPASVIFLSTRFAHHLQTEEFLQSFLSDAIAAIIHAVQSHKSSPVDLAFWISNIQALIYYFKRDKALVQITSEAQGRLSECMQDAYALLTKAVQADIEPLLDTAMLAYDAMPDLFADVKFEADKSQRLTMFFFGNSADKTRKSSDGRPLRRSQTTVNKGGRSGRPRRSSILTRAISEDSTGEAPQWITAVEKARGQHSHMRSSSGDTFVMARPSRDARDLFGSPSPRTITYILDCLLDLLQMCEVHSFVSYSIVRQLLCYLGYEMFNRVLTTREFCSRSRAMQIRMNATSISDWVRKIGPQLPVPHAGTESSSDSATTLYDQYFAPLVELVQLLQCLTTLPDLAEFLETTSGMSSLNILQQETVLTNYRYEVGEPRVAQDITQYLHSTATDVKERQRINREKISIEKASRRSMAASVSERRTMDGRPNLSSLDMATTTSRGTMGGLVRFSADPNELPRESGTVSVASPTASATPSNTGSSTLLPLHKTGRPRAGSRAGARRGLLLPIGRPASQQPGAQPSAAAKPSARTLFTNSSETASLDGRRRANTTEPGRDEDDHLDSQAFLHDVYQNMPHSAVVSTTHSYQSSVADETESVTSDPDTMSSSLRGPKGRKCRAEDMNELLDSVELLPFAVPTSREWLAWWTSHAERGSEQAKHTRDWSNETVRVGQQTGKDACAGAGVRAELIPTVPEEFLSVLSSIS